MEIETSAQEPNRLLLDQQSIRMHAGLYNMSYWAKNETMVRLDGRFTQVNTICRWWAGVLGVWNKPGRAIYTGMEGVDSYIV